MSEKPYKFQVHHIFPEALMKDFVDIFKEIDIKIDANDYSNRINLFNNQAMADVMKEFHTKNPDGMNIARFFGSVRHKGGHETYNSFVKDTLTDILNQKIDSNIKKAMVLDLHQQLVIAMREGSISLYNDNLTTKQTLKNYEKVISARLAKPQDFMDKDGNYDENTARSKQVESYKTDYDKFNVANIDNNKSVVQDFRIIKQLLIEKYGSLDNLPYPPYLKQTVNQLKNIQNIDASIGNIWELDDDGDKKVNSIHSKIRDIVGDLVYNEAKASHFVITKGDVELFKDKNADFNKKAIAAAVIVNAPDPKNYVDEDTKIQARLTTDAYEFTHKVITVVAKYSDLSQTGFNNLFPNASEEVKQQLTHFRNGQGGYITPEFLETVFPVGKAYDAIESYAKQLMKDTKLSAKFNGMAGLMDFVNNVYDGFIEGLTTNNWDKFFAQAKEHGTDVVIGTAIGMAAIAAFGAMVAAGGAIAVVGTVGATVLVGAGLAAWGYMWYELTTKVRETDWEKVYDGFMSNILEIDKLKDWFAEQTSSTINGLADVLNQFTAWGEQGSLQPLLLAYKDTIEQSKGAIDFKYIKTQIEKDNQLAGTEEDDTLSAKTSKKGVVAYGDKGADSIIGSQYQDILLGGEGNDRLYGEQGNDVINGNEGDDSLYGEQANDTLIGGLGNDTLNGGEGNDTLIDESGNETYDFIGDFGYDTIYDQDGQGVIKINYQSLSAGKKLQDDIWQSSHPDYMIRVAKTQENVEGYYSLHITSKSDKSKSITIPQWKQGDLGLNLTGLGEKAEQPASTGYTLGTDDNNIIDGYSHVAAYAGNDFILTTPNNDVVIAGAGNDVIATGAGDDVIYAGIDSDSAKDDDIVFTGAGSDKIYAGAGDDIIFSSSNLNGEFEYIIDDLKTEEQQEADDKAQLLPYHRSYSNIFLKEISYDSEAHTSYSPSYYLFYSHHILPQVSSSYLATAKGNEGIYLFYDVYDLTNQGEGYKGADIVYAGAGNDIVVGSSEHDGLYGEQGHDALYGLHGDDILDGGEGDDELVGGDGLDVLVGGLGRDRLIGGVDHDKLYGGEGDDVLIGDLSLLKGLSYPEGTPFERFGDDDLDGGQGDDELQGNGGNDRLLGGTGNDILEGDANFLDGQYHGQDVLDGGAGQDQLIGHGGDDKLYGGDGDDELQGDAIDLEHQYHGEDVLDGGAGNDRLGGQGGDDILYGGDGNDELQGDAMSLDGQHHGRDILDGGAGDDKLFGQGGDDNLYGGVGNDHLQGDATNLDGQYHGHDHLDGGAGNDMMMGEGGHDQLYGGEGDDQLQGDASHVDGQYHGDDVLDGGAGNDTIIGEGGKDRLYGGEGDDQLQGDYYELEGQYHSDDMLDGGVGNDTLFGQGGSDVLYGGEGDDILLGDDKDLDGQYHGHDKLYGGSGNDSLRGFDGDDILDGGRDHNLLYGGRGNDRLISHSAISDSLYGGEGDDHYDIAVRLASIYIADGEGTNHIYLDDGFDVNKLQIISNVMGMDAIQVIQPIKIGDAEQNFSVYIEGQKNIFEDGKPISGGYNFYLHYKDGEGRAQSIHLENYIKARTGLNFSPFIGVFKGVWGNYNQLDNTVYHVQDNSLDYHASSLSDEINLQTILDNADKYDVLKSDRYYMGAGHDTVQGSAQNDMIYGEDGDDTLHGITGNDHLYGGNGNDVLSVGTGNSLLDGGDGNDSLTAFNGQNTLDGGKGDDTLLVNDGNNVLKGGDGNDILTVGAGESTLDGGAGDDIFHIQRGSHQVIGGQGQDTINIIEGNIHYQLRAGDGIDRIINPKHRELSLQFLDVNMSQVSYHIADNGRDIIVQYGEGDQLILESAKEHFPITRIEFANGESLEAWQIKERILESIRGTAADESMDLSKGYTARVEAGAGNDFIKLGAGQGHYIDMEDGDDIIKISNIKHSYIQGGQGFDSYDLTSNISNIQNIVIEDSDWQGKLVLDLTNHFLGVTSSGFFSYYNTGDVTNIIRKAEKISDLYNQYKLTTENYHTGQFIYNVTTQSLDYRLQYGNSEQHNYLLRFNNIQLDDLNRFQVEIVSKIVSNNSYKGIDEKYYKIENSQFSLAEFMSMGKVEYIYGDKDDEVAVTLAHKKSSSIQTNAGDDTVIVHQPNQDLTIDTGTGHDTIYLYDPMQKDVLNPKNESRFAQNMNLNLGEGNDRVYGDKQKSNVLIDLGEGDDYFMSTGSVRAILGGEGNDHIEILQSAINNDGYFLAPRLDGGVGDDVLIANHAEIYGGEGNDIIHIANGMAEGGDGDDYIKAGPHGVSMNGGAGADTLIGGLGNDIFIADVLDTIVEDAEGLTGGYDTIHIASDVDLTRYSNLEGVNLLGEHDFKVYGNQFDNQIIGNQGHNYLDGKQGADRLMGGLGNDYYVLDHDQDEIVEHAGEGIDSVEQWVDRPFYHIDETGQRIKTASYQMLQNHVENLILKGTATTVFGNELDNSITLNEQNNFVNALAGNDVIVYQKGGGHDRISSKDDISAKDTLLIQGYDASQATFVRMSNSATGHDMLQIRFKGNPSDQITLIDYFAPTTNGQDYRIDEIRFVHNNQSTVLSQAQWESQVISQALNHAPTVNKHPKAITANVGKTLSVTFDADTIKDVDAYDSTLSYRMTLATRNAQGQYEALPSWLSFDAKTLTLTTTPTHTHLGQYQLILWGTDHFGLSAGTYVNINVQKAVESSQPSTPQNPTTPVVVDSSTNTNKVIKLQQKNNLLGKTSHDTLSGTEHHDRLQGFAGNDTLHGKAGNDVLIGGVGQDTLIGGAGNDLYYFSKGFGRDAIVNTGGGIDNVYFEGITTQQVKSGFGKVNNDLTLKVSGTTDQLTVKNFFLGGEYANLQFNFADNLHFSSQSILQAFKSKSTPSHSQSSDYYQALQHSLALKQGFEQFDKDKYLVEVNVPII